METGFIIPSHINNELTFSVLKKTIDNAHLLYPTYSIIVIDDFSPEPLLYKLQEYSYVKVVMSHQKGLGELLPYYYLYHNKPFDRAIIIHDNNILCKEIPNIETINFIKFIKSFDTNKVEWGRTAIPVTEYSQKNNIITYDEMINDFANKMFTNIRFYDYFKEIYPQKEKWLICFGVQSVITYDFLKELQDKTNIIDLFPFIKTRMHRVLMECIFAIACFYTGKLNMENCSCLGKWGTPPMHWAVTDDGFSVVQDEWMIRYHFSR